MIDFKSLNSGLNLGQFVVAEDDQRNINKMPNIWLQPACKDPYLRVLYRLSQIDNSLGVPIKSLVEPKNIRSRKKSKKGAPLAEATKRRCLTTGQTGY